METGRRRETTGDHELLWGYYYCDKGGTIEAEIFGDKAFFSKYEKDLMDSPLNSRSSYSPSNPQSRVGRAVGRGRGNAGIEPPPLTMVEAPPATAGMPEP